METIDLINLAAENDPSGFMDALNAMLADKAGQALDDLRAEVAQSIVTEPEVEDTTEVETEVEEPTNNTPEDAE